MCSIKNIIESYYPCQDYFTAIPRFIYLCAVTNYFAHEPFAWRVYSRDQSQTSVGGGVNTAPIADLRNYMSLHRVKSIGYRQYFDDVIVSYQVIFSFQLSLQILDAVPFVSKPPFQLRQFITRFLCLHQRLVVVRRQVVQFLPLSLQLTSQILNLFCKIIN